MFSIILKLFCDKLNDLLRIFTALENVERNGNQNEF
jgi:hypothetical protein